MTTPFDTTRLDEECERIARQHPFGDASAHEIKAALLGHDPPSDHEWTEDCWLTFCADTADLCRRPKMVSA